MTLVVSFATFVAGCGGDGDAPAGSTPVEHDTPPQFTSPTTVRTLEDTTGAIHTATAVDIDGQTVSFSIAGGDDAAAFRITSGGVLSFATPADFEAPTDQDHDNIYRLNLLASDGKAAASQSLTVIVSNRASAAFRVRRVASGLSSPVFVAPVPDGSGRLFVGEIAGRIRILSPGDGSVAASPFLDLRGTLSTDGERGLLGFATAPDFASSGRFFVFVTDPVGAIEVRRYNVSAGNRDIADVGSMRLMLRLEHPRNDRYGGWIGFDRSGDLFVATGDGGDLTASENTFSLLGKILRIDVSHDAFPADPMRNYAIPAINPYGGSVPPPHNPMIDDNGAPELWAMGLRNPFRATFDFGALGTGDGNLIIGDVGESRMEEIDFLPAGVRRAHFGWSNNEGTLVNRTTHQVGQDPDAQYPHGTGPRAGKSIVGGIVYRGPVESLRGQYFFADHIEPNVWSLPIERFPAWPTVEAPAFTSHNADFFPDAGAFTNITAFGADQAGNMYIVDMDGEIFAIEAAPGPQPAPAIASRARAQRATVKRHLCIDAWDGHTVRWIDNQMVLADEGFACTRKYYDKVSARRGE